MPYADAEKRQQARRRSREKLRRKPCSHPGCNSCQDQHGLCSMHARRKRLGQDMDAPNQRSPVGDQCEFPGCEKAVLAKGLCAGHCTQRRRGYKLTPIRVPLSPEGRRKRNAEMQQERRYKVGGHVPKGLKEKLRQRQKGRCGICLFPLRGMLHIDHILPVKLGGTNNPKNLQLSHRDCNLSKGATHPADYAQSIGRLL